MNNYFTKPVLVKQNCDIIYFHGANQCLTTEKLPLEKFKLIAKEISTLSKLFPYRNE